MSVAYAAPMYVGLSTILCLSYSCIECTKDKGKIDTTTKSMLFAWCLVSLIVASVVAGASGEMMAGMTNMTHLLIAALLACVTLSVSCSMIYWS
jgi:hypothetical protein